MTANKTTVCDIVKLRNGEVGIVRFIGEIAGESGVYYGIDLSEPSGNTDGSYRGVYYFTTHDEYGIFTKKTEIVKTLQKNEYNLPRVTVGDIVSIKQLKVNAIIRFIGWTTFHPEVIWYGLQLEEAMGDNNGTIDDRKYFTCAPHYGLFVNCTDIGDPIKIGNNATSKKKRKGVVRKKKKAKKHSPNRSKKGNNNDNNNNNNNNNVSFDQFMANYKERQSFDQNFVEHYHEKFYFQVTNPFFRAYSEMYGRFDAFPKEIIELILRYCTTSIDTKSKNIKDFCINIFSDQQCYYNILYSHTST